MSSPTLTGQDEARRALEARLATSLDVSTRHEIGKAKLWLSNLEMGLLLDLLRAPFLDRGAEEMETELRPFASGEGEGLDEVVVKNAELVHAETMSDTSLWIGISDKTSGLLHIWVNAIRKKGKTLLVMTASDEGTRDTVADIRALPVPADLNEGGEK